MNNGKKFYDLFHKKSRPSYRVIDNKNFTYRIVLSVLDKYIKGKKELEVLDYGCGVGTLGFFLVDKGHKVTGIDISREAIKTAKQSAKELGLEKQTQFYTLEEGRGKIKNKKFDFVMLIEVIEHVKEDQELVDFLFDHLKKNGIFILSTPSKNAPVYRLGLAKKFDKRVGHLRRYEIKELVNLVNEAGMQVIETLTTEGVVRNSLYLFPVLGKLIKFIRGPISDFVTSIDKLTISLFGGSNIFIISKKK